MADDDSMGYALHCYNAIYLNGRWIKVDARGNKPGVNAQFSLDEPVLAFPCRPQYGEYFFKGIYAAPCEITMRKLEQSKCLQDVLDSFPSMITELPDITEENSMNITYINTITPEEFNVLRASVGWDVIEHSLTVKGLENTAFAICAKDGEKTVGMARVITDYGYVVYIADVIVLPEYQGKGISGEIMTRVMTYINENIAQGHGKYIALMTAKGKEEFYEKFGFIKRPTDKLGCGMTIWIEMKGDAE